MVVHFPFQEDQYVLIGTISRAHGLNGEVKIAVRLRQQEPFLHIDRLTLIGSDGRMTAPLKLLKVRQQGKQFIAKIDTIDTKEEADLTAGMGVLLLREDIAEPDSGPIFLSQFEGLTVRTKNPDEIIGTVATVENYGAQDIMIVRDGSKEYLIPMVDAIVVSHDEKQVVIDPPPGLLEINTSNSNR